MSRDTEKISGTLGAGPGPGTPRLVAAAERTGHRGPPRDGRQLPESRRRGGAGPGPAGGSAAPFTASFSDNLKEGVLAPDIYDPTLNPL